jgi:hypothetical protein
LTPLRRGIHFVIVEKRLTQRHLTLPKGATLAQKHWGSAEELKRTAKFIGDIGLAHLAKLPAV